jgi:ParB-like chromosome segregation protein Spo0J
VDGLARALVVAEDGTILDGEAVWRAAKLEGITSIPVLRVFGLSENQKRRLRIGLNRHQQNADWDGHRKLRHSVPAATFAAGGRHHQIGPFSMLRYRDGR